MIRKTELPRNPSCCQRDLRHEKMAAKTSKPEWNNHHGDRRMSRDKEYDFAERRGVIGPTHPVVEPDEERAQNARHDRHQQAQLECAHGSTINGF